MPPVVLMEFADLILVSRLDHVRLRRPGEEVTTVTVAVTGHHLILSLEESHSRDQQREVWLLHRLLYSVSSPGDRSNTLTLKYKGKVSEISPL